MSTADTIYELVKTLPEEQANLVLKFTQFIQQESLQPYSAADVSTPEKLQSWRMLVQELSGAWADFPSAEELRASLGRDLAREVF